MNINIGKVLENRANLAGEKIGFIHQENQYTFSEMNDRANRFAYYLQKKGFKKGDHIALLCKNNEDFVAAFFGAAKIGVLTVVVNYRLQAAEIEYILNHSDASLLVYDADFQQLINQLQHIEHISYLISNETVPSLIEVFESISEVPSVSDEDSSNANEAILMMYTSGTTGKPKGALLSHANLYSAAIGLSHTVDWWEDDRFLMVAPFFHIGGMAPLITNVFTGCTTVLMEVFEPVKAWNIIEKEQITTMMTVPAMLSFLMKTHPLVKPDTSSIRNITCGASAVPPSLILAFRQLGIPVQQVYGITEFSGAISFWKESMDSDKYASMGKAVFQHKISIVDPESTQPLEAGQIGEIVLEGPQTFVGYYKNEEAYKKAMTGNTFSTGDLGYLDPQGFLYVVDRLKDMIISGGENIYSAELELVLSEHPEIAEVAVVGVPHEKWGEIPKAFIVKKPETNLTEETVIEFCKQKLSSYKVIKQVEFIEQLPRNAVGKILKTKLKKPVAPTIN